MICIVISFVSVNCVVICLTLSLLLQVPVQPLVPLQMMPQHVAAGYYYKSNVGQGSHAPLVSNLSRGQSSVQFAPVTPADLHWMHQMHSVSTAMQNPFVGLPVTRCDLSPALMAELLNRRMWYYQQLLQQQILYHPFATPDNNLLHRFAMPSVPLTAPQCVPASGVHPYPVMKPVLQQPLLQTQLNNDPGKYQSQVCVSDNANCCRSWPSNKDSQDEIWTTPADGKSIWNSAAVGLSNPHFNACHVSSKEQNHTLKPYVTASGGAVSSDVVDHYDTIAAKTGQRARSTVGTNQSVSAAAAGLCSRQDIWPTAFGPFTRPPQGNVASISHLPPSLETRVVARIGVIGQRDPEMQKNASLEGYDSGVDSAGGDSHDTLGHCSSSELTVDSSAPQTAVCDSDFVGSLLCDAVEQQSFLPVQERSITNHSSSVLVDMIAQTAPHQKNMSLLQDKFTFEDEFKSLQFHPHSHNYWSTNASEDDSCVRSLSSYSDVDRTVTQTANTECKMGTSCPASDAVDRTQQTDNTVLLTDIIAQLSDMLRKPDELCFIDICNALYDKLTASSSANCSSRDAKIAGTLCESAISSSSTDWHPFVSDDPFHSSTSAVTRQDEGSLVDSVINRCRTAASHAGMQWFIKSDHSNVSCESDANTQLESNLIDGVSMPEARTSLCDTVSVTRNPDALETDMPSLHLTDTAAVQQVLSKVAESHANSFENNSDKHTNRASNSSVEDLLVLLQRWKSS